MVQPIVFPGGPVGTMQERDILLRKKVEERNLQHLMSKKRTRINSQAKNKNSNADVVLPAVTNRKTSSAKNVKICKPKKEKSKNYNDSMSISSASSSSSNSSISSSNSNDNAACNSEVDSDNNLSENEQDYDMSAVSEYYWLIGKVHMDADDKEMYLTTRVEIDKNGYIVAYRKRADSFGKPIGKELKDSYHVADIVEYTKKSAKLLSTSTSKSSSSISKSSQPSPANAISDSLICELIGCNDDQYDVCVGCHKMLCAKHSEIHDKERNCHTTVNKYIASVI